MTAVSRKIFVNPSWAAHLLSGLAVAFLLFDVSLKLLQSPMAIQGTTELGYPASAVFTIGVIELACLLLYVCSRSTWPRCCGAACICVSRGCGPCYRSATSGRDAAVA
jgi:hypothetical protein